MLATINVKYRDVRQAVPFLFQAWMFATPIIYPISFIPENWRWIFMMNPLTGLIGAYRSVIFGNLFDLNSLAISILLILLIFIFSVYYFRKMEREIADIV